jgi:hypothetical protein
MFCLLLRTKYCTEIILTHSKKESQKPWLTGIEKISSLINSEESHCYMHIEECENDLKFVMKVSAICPLNLHDNETKNKKGKRMLKLVRNCCKNYFNLSCKCTFETVMVGLLSIIRCPVYTQNNMWLQPSPLCNSVTLMQRWMNCTQGPLDQCFSTAGLWPGTRLWYQLYRALAL